ncbi:MAG: ATP-binding cassette domain-containing protein [Oribacterium parvum]|uniref:ABC transporter ATP-binding protein n=1 Tax=Oribacterium parvum TaxID=1501329 RepID=UPI001CAF40B9|nr:oligopeptide/dipeptide ABC transporter ATP-binding protein [Oribacterium parvum]MBF1269558.1 ATP-binding cassette domain-containing protein [Oribacterium parvum]
MNWEENEEQRKNEGQRKNEEQRNKEVYRKKEGYRVEEKRVVEEYRVQEYKEQEEELLSVEDLSVEIPLSEKTVYPVSGIRFSLKEGELAAIVGESGSGKSVAMKSILGLLPSGARRTAKKLSFKGKDLISLSEKEYYGIRGKEISMIFQDPMTALNPLMRIGEQISEVILRNRKEKMTKQEAKEEAIRLLSSVGITDAEKKYRQYPHEFSGGMRQRVLIAMALSCSPALLIADEPTTALDVTIQAQILKLLKEEARERNTAVILITHDLSLVFENAESLFVMYGGKIMEKGKVEEIFSTPAHPYTKALLAAIPSMEMEKGERLKPIEGNPPSLFEKPMRCPFLERCKERMPICEVELPKEQSLSKTHSFFATKK